MIEYLQKHRPGVFDADAVRVLVTAFDEAWQSVQNNDPANATQATRDALAKEILAAAMRGERDHRRLCDAALLHLTSAHRT